MKFWRNALRCRRSVHTWNLCKNWYRPNHAHRHAQGRDNYVSDEYTDADAPKLGCFPVTFHSTMLKLELYKHSLHAYYKNSRHRISQRRRLMFFSGEGPRSRCYGRTQPWGFLCNPVMKMISFVLFQVVEYRWNETDRGNRSTGGKKPVPVPLCPP
jgi:hypothetical protein